MKKLLLLLISIILTVSPISALALDYPSVDSKTVEIYDLNDGKELYEIGSDNKISIASLTKIATTITAIETIADLDETVTITKAILSTVTWDSSVAGLKAGDKVTYRDLLYASMLPSGADATNSIAILTSGSIDAFVVKMNDLASRIGLTNTHFVNVTGLDADGHYSTADDVRTLLEYSLKNSLFREIFTTKSYTLSNGLTVYTTLYKYKAKDEDFQKILGSKTGFTSHAGYCLAALSNINGHEIITIVLKATSEGSLYHNVTDTVRLIDFLNNNYKEETLVEENTFIKKIPVELSTVDEYEIYSDKVVSAYLPSDYNAEALKIEYDGAEQLDYSAEDGDKIGVVKYYFDSELLYEQDVVLKDDIEVHFGKWLGAHWYLIILFIIVFLFVVMLCIRAHNLRKRKKR